MSKMFIGNGFLSSFFNFKDKLFCSELVMKTLIKNEIFIDAIENAINYSPVDVYNAVINIEGAKKWKTK
jgi:hypothetical protein